jgi:multicomponent Na+:H+ antiporter subunit F
MNCAERHVKWGQAFHLQQAGAFARRFRLVSLLSPRMNIVLTIVFLVLGAALILALVRLVIGPTLPDRVVAIDLIAFVSIGFALVYAIATDKPDFLEVALVLGLVAFLATVALARFVERRSIAGGDEQA